MKIIADDRFKPSFSLDELRPCLREQVSNVWRLWAVICDDDTFASLITHSPH
jgi:hypothetical protein